MFDSTWFTEAAYLFSNFDQSIKSLPICFISDVFVIVSLYRQEHTYKSVHDSYPFVHLKDVIKINCSGPKHHFSDIITATYWTVKLCQWTVPKEQLGVKCFAQGHDDSESLKIMVRRFSSIPWAFSRSTCLKYAVSLWCQTHIRRFIFSMIDFHKIPQDQ